MKYACLELNIELKNDKVAIVKIPFESKDDAFEYLATHYDASFHKSCWIE